MGSSLGGLISHYIGMKYQNIFRKAGVFSPSYWFNDSIYDFTYLTGKQDDIMFYIMGGTNESPTLVQEMEMMVDTLYAIGIGGDYLVNLEVVPGGQHNEQLWREEFGKAYEWLFLEDPYNISNYSVEKSQFLYYQDGNLVFKPSWIINDQGSYLIQLFTITGQLKTSTNIKSNEAVALPSEMSGIYIARISGVKGTFTQKVFIPGHCQ
jgi:alpha-glucosidase